MRSRRVTTALLGALASLAVAAPAVSARDAVVESFDGTPIVTHFFAAEGLEPGARAPTVLVGHGYGMTGDTDPESASEELFGSIGLGPLRRAGYNVLTWDARGFGGSGGEVMVDSKDFEGRDVQALIDYVAQQPEAQLDAPGDPRLGMNGPSYGGGIQFVTAAIDRRVDAITPTIAWHSLLTSLYKEETVKQGWGTILAGAGGSAFAGGIFSPAGPQTGGTSPAITQAFTEGASTGKFSPESVEFFASRGVGPLIERIRVPTLIVHGTVDTLFTLQESMANHAILKRNGVPVRMLWFCGGHGACLTGTGPTGNVERSVIAWLDRHVKDDRSIDTGAPFSFVAQDGELRDGATFPPRRTGAISASGAGTLPISPSSNPSGQAQIAATPAADAVNVDIPAPDPGAELIGEPRLSLRYSGTGAPADTRVFAQIVDLASNLVVGNAATPIPVRLDGEEHAIERPLEPIAYVAGPGAQLRLQIVSASSIYTNQRSSGALELSEVDVRVPVVNTSARPRLALRIGPTRGMRRARRGRSFRVRVRAVGATLRGTRIVLRNRRGRRVGRSRELTLSRARSRRVRIRVSRRIRPGRYRFRAAGTSAEGQRVSGQRRVRVRRSAK